LGLRFRGDLGVDFGDRGVDFGDRGVACDRGETCEEGDLGVRGVFWFASFSFSSFFLGRWSVPSSFFVTLW